jgi:integrase
MNARTGYEYSKRLEYFGKFIAKEYHLTIDEIILTMTRPSQGPHIDIYDLLSGYISYLQKSGIKPSTIKYWISTARGFLEYYDVEISPRKFRLKVKFPRIVRQSREALSNEDIIEILNACSFSLKLKTYVMFLAATGVRATEATSIRLCDYDVVRSKVSIRGEYTKTKTDRYVFLTSELNKQLQSWLNYKYRTRKVITYNDSRSKRTQVTIKNPIRQEDEFIFSSKYGKDNIESSVKGMYITLVAVFEKALDRMGGKFAAYEDSSKRRRKITLHSFRRHVKSTISDLGYGDYSEWYKKSKSNIFRLISQLLYEMVLIIKCRCPEVHQRIFQHFQSLLI